MKRIVLKSSVVALVTTMLMSCTNTGNDNNNTNADSLTNSAEEIILPAVIPETETFYNLDSNSAIVVSKPISYDVTVKNYIQGDDWEEERLSATNNAALVNAIFQAVYKGRLQPIDYFTDAELTIDDIKNIEKQNSRNQIGKIMFTENWYFSEKDLRLVKDVEFITLGYEIIDKSNNELTGFKPAFKVNLKKILK